jgi:hypothetical protein
MVQATKTVIPNAFTNIKIDMIKQRNPDSINVAIQGSPPLVLAGIPRKYYVYYHGNFLRNDALVVGTNSLFIIPLNQKTSLSTPDS